MYILGVYHESLAGKKKPDKSETVPIIYTYCFLILVSINYYIKP